MESAPVSDEIYQILDLARWAPSGDNCQPWQFEIIDQSHICVHLSLDAENVYEYNNGQPAFIAAGALIENISIASSIFGKKINIDRIYPAESNQVKIDISFAAGDNGASDALVDCIRKRSVQRDAYKNTPLPQNVRHELESILPAEMEISWYSGLHDKLGIISVYMCATEIRLTIPETYKIHNEMMDWKHKRSATGIPVAATGLSGMTRLLMRWVIKSPSRMKFFNKYLMGTLMPKLELDFLPGVACSSHFAVSWKHPQKNAHTIEEYIEFGRSLQRFWLTLTKYDMVMQPEIAPLIFGFYGAKNIDFTSDQKMKKLSVTLAEKVMQFYKKPVDQILFLGRVGFPKTAQDETKVRSVRKPLSELLISRTAEHC